MGKSSHGQDLLVILCPNHKSIWCSMAQGFQHLKSHNIIYIILSFFIVLALIYNILNGALQALSAFLMGMIANQLLPVQNSNAGKL